MGRRRKGREINGVLLLDKPQDISSNDALQKSVVCLMPVRQGIRGHWIL